MSADAHPPDTDLDRTTTRIKEEWNRLAQDPLRIIDNRAHSESDLRALGERDAEALLADLGEAVVGPDARVVEIGCGIGRLLVPLARRFRDVWGVDVSEEMVRLAGERLASIPNIRLLVNNGSDLADLPSGHFDFCCSLYALEYAPDRWVVESYLREAARVLTDGGILKIQVGGVYARSPYREAFDLARGPGAGVRFTLAEIAGIAEAAGFDLMAVYHPHEGGPERSRWNDPLPQRRIWVVGRKSDGMDEWERVCWRIARTLREAVAPGARVITPEGRMRWHLNAAGAGHVDLLAADTPADGHDAVRTLEEIKGQGVAYLLFSRYTQWWLTTYPELAAHVRTHGREVARTDDLALFELGG